MRKQSVIRVLAAAMLLSACGEEAVVQTGLTGIEVRVRHDDALDLDQILFTSRDALTGERIFPPTRRPEEPERLGDGESSVVILLAEELGGRRIVVRVDGLAQSTVVASAFDQVDLEAKRITEVSLTLGALIECGDGSIISIAEACDDGNTTPGDGCDQTCSIEDGFTCNGEPSLCNQCGNEICDTREDGCNCPADCPNAPSCFPGQRCLNNTCICDDLSCPGGCCAGVNCVGSGVSTCGIDGDVCSDCSVSGDTCTAGGTCECSGSAACATGEHCVVGACICDNVGCAGGCCSGDTCNPPSLSACGIGGSSCQGCNSDRADACLDGVCRCGLGNGCASGQSCSGGSCLCDGTSCPSGCCAGTSCAAPTFDACGTAGAACAPCDSALADDCTAGACTCGGAAACVAGQRCLGGDCVCDSVSCPTGCCNIDVCEIASAATCGTDGSACIDCGVFADTCTDGACACGSNSPCGPGQECVSGVCECTAASCADGCCNGDTCEPATLDRCGTGGGNCATCDPGVANACNDGVCECGASPACTGNDICQGGTCETGCNPCATGCCLNPTTCVASPTLAECGFAGAACVACDPTLADDCTTGACTCNGGPACLAGQRCAGASGCVCDPVSCPSGCCDSGGLCVDPLTATECGAPGVACVDCGIEADNCDTGACECGTTGSACAAGQHCVGGVCVCNATSCPSGCCEGDVCTTPSMTACGTSGNACIPCDVGLADDCVSGACQCGSNPSCTAGSTCDTGACACDPGTCTGCCDGTGCHVPSFATCGTGGVACVACDAAISDDCTAGACTCGSSAECAVDEACSSGTCVPICNPTSCANGCCSGSTCVTATDLTACGADGAACNPCDPLTADDCTAGGCTCGGAPACTGGETCQLGVCAPPPCDVLTCPTGCCDAASGQCRVGNHKFWCGTTAVACEDCDAQGLRCVSQSCQ